MNKKITLSILILTLAFGLTNIGFSETINIIPDPPKLKPSSYILIDYNSQNILAEKNLDEKLPPASLTKIATVYVVGNELANGNISLDDEVIISKKAWKTGGSRMFVNVGSKVKLETLLHGIIIQSGNDASVAISEHISGSEEAFADLMNGYAKNLGMTNTNFKNSTGLPHKEHYTTVKDMAILARSLIKKFPELYKINSIKEFTYNNIKQQNRNKLLWKYDLADGIKTGHTKDAGYCLAASAKKEDMRLINIVMGADSSNARFTASKTLFNYGFNFFNTHKMYKAGEPITKVKVWKSGNKDVGLTLKQDLYITIPKGQYSKLESIVNLDGDITAPVKTGVKQGVINIVLNKETIASEELFTMQDIVEGSIFNKAKDKLYLLFK